MTLLCGAICDPCLWGRASTDQVGARYKMSTYKYKQVTPDLIKEALQFYHEYYLPHDPVLKAIGCTEVTDMDSQTTLGYLKQGLSWCAVNEVTGNIIGIKINRSLTLFGLPDIKLTFDDYIRRGWSRSGH